MIEQYIWIVSGAVFVLLLPLMAYFWRLSGQETEQRKTYRVEQYEQTEWGVYFVVRNRSGDVVAGPTFYQRATHECAVLNRSA